MVEICCGGYYDAKQAFLGGADRIELNSGLFLGGLTPSIASLELIKEEFDLNTICMIRPRGAGFYYNDEDKKVMFRDTKALLKANADGIAFGFLHEDKNIDIESTKKMIDIVKSFDCKKEVVFHRAFDCVSNPYDSIETLIDLGIDRLLTSGLKEKAFDGIDLIKELNEKYGDKIEILAGSGINYKNAKEIITKTGINQIHSSCKDFIQDNTTSGKNVSYAYLNNENKYDVVSFNLVKSLVEMVK
ncbi:copper homeostasis protein CutC [uncultured Tyzzerella sp.]|uniref:copper homeostasis protein CutC n=1 Tax=uncultured Tyzzerella sp. TaxID=2321398 RepID=UPI00294367B3|nr:copper homeostasis protein CutC [uncultured Tyzzerella sp.]